jgi:hypothetical protein
MMVQRSDIFFKKSRIILYLGLFSVLSFLIVQPMFPYFEWMLKRFDLDDFIHVGVYGSSYNISERESPRF